MLGTNKLSMVYINYSEPPIGSPRRTAVNMDPPGERIEISYVDEQSGNIQESRMERSNVVVVVPREEEAPAGTTAQGRPPQEEDITLPMAASAAVEAASKQGNFANTSGHEPTDEVDDSLNNASETERFSFDEAISVATTSRKDEESSSSLSGLKQNMILRTVDAPPGTCFGLSCHSHRKLKKPCRQMGICG